MFETLPVKKTDPEAILPTRAHPDDAGLDLYCLEDTLLGPAECKPIKTGISVAIPYGFVGLIYDRSSMAKKGLKSAGGVIDAGYRGEIHIVLINLTQREVKLNRGDRIAQLLILQIATPAVQELGSLDSTHRGENGFGSTGV